MATPASEKPSSLSSTQPVHATSAAIPAGAHLVGGADANSPGDSQGVVTSPTFSPALDAHIALGLLAGGRERLGEAIYAADPLRRRHIPVEVVSPHFYDPEGARLDA